MLRKNFIVINKNGRAIDPREAIVPICTQDRTRNIIVLGTGFYICPNIIATAKHVVTNPSGAPIDEIIHGKKMQIYDPIFVVHMTEGQYCIRNVFQTSMHTVDDVAICQLKPITDKKTGKSLSNKRIGLASKSPEVGENIKSYSFPNSAVEESEFKRKVLLNADWYNGKIIEHLPNGRDKTFLPGECWRVNMPVLHQSSGAPVAMENGEIFGINSTGMDGVNDVNFISSVKGLFELSLDPIYIKIDEGRIRKVINVSQYLELIENIKK